MLGEDAGAWALDTLGIERLQGPEAFLGCSSRGGSVHIARWRGQIVAVKLAQVGSPSNVTSGSLPPSHPNISRVLLRSCQGGKLVEVRELAEGGELYDRIAEEGRLSADEALSYLREVAAGVAHSHAHGLIHGQLHPEHVLLSIDEHVQLVGFHAVGFPPEPSALVKLRPVRPLDAPELHQGLAEIASARLVACDVWALGILTLAMVTGRPPFASAAPRACARFASFVSGGLEALLEDELELVPEWLRPLVTSMLQPQPSARPNMATVLAGIGATAADTSPAEFSSPAVSLSTVDEADRLSGAAGAAAGTEPSDAALGPHTEASKAAARAALESAMATTASQQSTRGSHAAAHALAVRQMLPPPVIAPGKRAQSTLAASAAVSTASGTSGSGGSGGSGGGGGGSSSSSCGGSSDSNRQSDVGACGSGAAVPAAAHQPAAVAAAVAGQPPIRQLKTSGYVRSLGWEGLPHPAGELVLAITTALSALQVAYEYRAATYAFVVKPPDPTRPSTSPQSAPESSPASLLGGADTLDTPQLESHMIECLGLTPRPSGFDWERPQPLVVFIHVLKESAASARHDVSIRRVQGASWRFQTFYSAFREQMSHQLGLSGYMQLSLYSPLVTKRTLSPSQQRASSWFAERTTLTGDGMARAGDGRPVHPSAQPSASPPIGRGMTESGAELTAQGTEDEPRFKRTKTNALSMPMPIGSARRS